MGKYKDTLVYVFFLVLPNFYYAFNLGTINNLLALSFFTLCVFCSGSVVDNQLRIAFSFYFFLQILSMISAFLGVNNGVSNSFDLSIFRPSILFLLVYGIYSREMGCVETFSDKIIKLSFIFIFISCVFIFLCLFNGTFYDLYRSFYLASNKDAIADSSVGFFASSYFAAFVYLFFYYVNLSSLIIMRKLSILPIVIANFILIFFSFSKTALASSCIASIFCIFFVNSKSYTKIIISLIFIFVFMYFYEKVYTGIEDFRVVISLQEMLNGAGGGADSLSTRIEQINNALELSIYNFGFGVGVNSSILNESFIADFSYRYGIIGLVLYFFSWIYAIRFSYCAYASANSLKIKVVMLAAFFWFLSLPVISMSNSVLEMGKGAILYSIILAFLMAFSRKNSAV